MVSAGSSLTSPLSMGKFQAVYWHPGYAYVEFRNFFSRLTTKYHMISVPKYVYEDGLFDFLAQLGECDDSQRIVLDLSNITHYSITALVALVTKINCWREDGKDVDLIGYDQADAFEYLQRINFLDLSGVEAQEGFQRHDPTGRFVPINMIGERGDTDAERVSEEAAACLVGQDDDPDLHDAVEYSVSELVLNTEQHSEGTGFIGAQYYGERDLTRIVVADYGIGIRRTFRHYGRHHIPNMTHLDAIEKALEPEVSSKMHPSNPRNAVNAGIGLTLLQALARRVDGRFIVASGDGYYSLEGGGRSFAGSEFNGTLSAMAFRRGSVDDFDRLFNEAEKEAGLVDESEDSVGPEDLFT